MNKNSADVTDKALEVEEVNEIAEKTEIAVEGKERIGMTQNRNLDALTHWGVKSERIRGAWSYDTVPSLLKVTSETVSEVSEQFAI